MANHHLPTVWDTAAEDFPAMEPAANQLRFLLNFAVLAPSGHNTQPCRFKLDGDAVELYADRSRSLPVVDPDDRELTIACGACLAFLRLAMQNYGFAPAVEILPDRSNHDLLARVLMGAGNSPSEEEKRLFRAIPKRRTNRNPFADRPLPIGLIADLSAVATERGAWLYEVPVADFARVAGLIEAGDRRQWEDECYRRELATWIHPNRRGDGLSHLYRHGLGPLVMRSIDLGKSTAQQDGELAKQAPLLMVLGTTGDGPLDWIAAGEALGRLLLRARTEGVDASFFNQPVQVPDLRSELAETIACSGFPQILLRLGYGPEVEPSPRRPVEEFLIDEQESRELP